MSDYKTTAYRLFNLIWILILLPVGYYIYIHAAPVLERIDKIHYGYIFTGLGTGMLFTLPSVWVLDEYLGKYHIKKRIATASFLMFVPALGKYIPGKIWVTGSFIINAKQMAQISAKDVLGFQVYFQLIGLGSTLILLILGYIIGHSMFYSISYLLFSVLIVVAFFAFIIYIKSKVNFEFKGLINPKSAIRHLLAILLQKSTRGFSLLIFISAFVDVGYYLEIFYAYILAMQTGVLAFFAPAGIGITEGTYMLVLSPLKGAEFAVLVALISRLWSTAIDFLLAAVGIVIKYIYLSEKTES